MEFSSKQIVNFQNIREFTSCYGVFTEQKSFVASSKPGSDAGKGLKSRRLIDSSIEHLDAAVDEAASTSSSTSALSSGLEDSNNIVKGLVSSKGQKEEHVITCARMSNTKLFNGTIDVATCLEFWSATGNNTSTVVPAISAPKDTVTTLYGAVSVSGSCKFVTRYGWSVPFNCSLLSHDLYNLMMGHQGGNTLRLTLSQMVFKAKLDVGLSKINSIFSSNNNYINGMITSVELMMLIERTAMIIPFMNTMFVGQVINSQPPLGVNATQLFRWDLGDSLIPYRLMPDDPTTTLQVLQGTFTNLYDSDVDPVTGACMPALISDDITQEWYEHAVGNSTALKFYWYPDMHLSLDSELVPIFSNSVSYMAHVPNPAELLSSNVNVEKASYSFVIHGTPIGVLQFFSGKFMPAASSVAGMSENNDC
ncbi:hypothetical protein CEUSTIGMA_g9316.t1 [Chlamydomonas eustigma]|uniref:Uncharacterized protein n=1 Tax=Chlamydomonas eustigma TaxID=1157962 RepID=A0A250XFN0_9CHLO|nr:hypothetical protein CEUSTIGMA_g9316.t1 [Chlamydomonas eustigma]|eukprot:GAX81888.1 hypothetical protein CEUSTIGMA_g9316.t1 [Chlamydomonas eustigma]